MGTMPNNRMFTGSNTGSNTNVFGFGSNQYGAGWPQMSYPSASTYGNLGEAFGMKNAGMQPGNAGYQIGTSYSPTLTSDLFGYLQGQIGQGLPTYPGQLTAGPVSQYQDIAGLLTGGQTNLPYASQMQQMAKTGDPITVTPEWQAAVQAMQQNIQQNQADLQTQLAAGGNLVGTPYGTTMQDFQQGATATQNALLAQEQATASENAAQREAGMQQYLSSLGLNLGGQMQNIQQLGVSNAYNEWLRTQPQYNPLLNMQYGAATTFPPYLNPQQNPYALLIPSILNAINVNKKPPVNINTGGNNTGIQTPTAGGGPAQTPNTFPGSPTYGSSTTSSSGEYGSSGGQSTQGYYDASGNWVPVLGTRGGGLDYTPSGVIPGVTDTGQFPSGILDAYGSQPTYTGGNTSNYDLLNTSGYYDSGGGGFGVGVYAPDSSLMSMGY